MAVTLFTARDSQLYIGVAMRSSEVFMANNIRGIVPNFGMESNRIGDQTSKFGLFFYNYVREFLEEYFDLEELVDAVHAKRMHPDWIFQLPQAVNLMHEVHSGMFHMSCEGMVVNPWMVR
jgi:hypothetical protein